jgi:hypothetical protein
MGCSHVRAQVSHLLKAEPIQPTKSAGQNSGVRIGGTKVRGSCRGWEIPAGGEFTIVDCRLPICEVPPFWRLTRMFLMGKRRPCDADFEENPTRGDYIYENTAS